MAAGTAHTAAGNGKHDREYFKYAGYDRAYGKCDKYDHGHGKHHNNQYDGQLDTDDGQYDDVEQQ